MREVPWSVTLVSSPEAREIGGIFWKSLGRYAIEEASKNARESINGIGVSNGCIAATVLFN